MLSTDVNCTKLPHAEGPIRRSWPGVATTGYVINLYIHNAEIKLATVYGATIDEVERRADIVAKAFEQAERL
jgi:hypothetical protein